jgi:hypothetical protein
MQVRCRLEPGEGIAEGRLLDAQGLTGQIRER